MDASAEQPYLDQPTDVSGSCVIVLYGHHGAKATALHQVIEAARAIGLRVWVVNRLSDTPTAPRDQSEPETTGTSAVAGATVEHQPDPASAAHAL